MYYPIEDARNLGRAVIDMNSYTNDYLGRYEKTPINQSFATSYSYKDFNRLSEKTEISSKVNVETNSNILNVFSHSSKSSFEEVSVNPSQVMNRLYMENPVSDFIQNVMIYHSHQIFMIESSTNTYHLFFWNFSTTQLQMNFLTISDALYSQN